MEWIVISVLLLVVGILSFLCYNLYNKIIFFEDKIVDIQDRVQSTIDIMKQIDLRGAFESDDEVGDVFSQMKRLVDNLGQYIYEEKEGE